MKQTILPFLLLLFLLSACKNTDPVCIECDHYLKIYGTWKVEEWADNGVLRYTGDTVISTTFNKSDNTVNYVFYVNTEPIESGGNAEFIISGNSINMPVYHFGHIAELQTFDIIALSGNFLELQSPTQYRLFRRIE